MDEQICEDCESSSNLTATPSAEFMDNDTGPAGRPSVTDLTGDNVFARIARENWLVKTPTKVLSTVVDNELWGSLAADGFPRFSLMLLEQLQTLERYLWPGYSNDASNNHVILLALLVNVKRQERLPVWPLFTDRVDAFQSFFRRVLHLSIDQSLSIDVRTHLLTFIVGAYQSLDNGLVRKECASLVGVGIWHHLHSDSARDVHLAKSTQLQKAARAAAKKFEGADQAGQARLRFERSWLYTLLLDFLNRLYNEQGNVDVRNANILYCERFVELLCDLQSQLPTRRYVNTLLQDLNLLPAIRLSRLYEAGEDAMLLRDMVDLLSHYTNFPINDHTGIELSRQDREDACSSRIAMLQKVALRLHPEKLKILILANFGSLSQRSEMASHLEGLADQEIIELCAELGLRTEYGEKSMIVSDRPLFTEMLISYVEQPSLYSDKLRTSLPSLPTEKSLYEPSLLRSETYNGTRPLALPKMNLQYLTIGDFMYRSFLLYRIEAFHEIRKHLEDTIKRLKPSRHNGATEFDGFSQMAIPIGKPAIIDTSPPQVGHEMLTEIKTEVIIDVSRLQAGLRRDWESLRQGDVVYLLAVHPSETASRLTNGHLVESEMNKVGLKALRCAEVITVLDDNGRVIRQDNEQHGHIEGSSRPRHRRLLLKLDALAYESDKSKASNGTDNLYSDINLVVRRRARENTFKPILDSARQLAISGTAIPHWLREVFLGFGDPASATYERLPNRLRRLDYRDTFLDWQHLIESLPGKTVEPDPRLNGSFPPPYVLEARAIEATSVVRPTKKRRRDQPDGAVAGVVPMEESFQVSTYKPANTGPYLADMPKLNAVRFTAAQIQAITSGTQPGLTVIVGPPGTGKTDVATQIINNIYHNFPQQRTLLIAHSNQALNQLFQKIVALDIDERHLLRLGHGEEELKVDSSFSKAGRVDSFLERGGKHLLEVQRLAVSIGAPGAHGNSCETADYFHQVWIQPKWKFYWDVVSSAAGNDVISAFPFHAFFADAPQPLFPPQSSKDQIIDIAKGCERHMNHIFQELADIRPFEILRNQRDKSNYLLVKEARIIAMTSTHAAMHRHEIAALGFQYDNVIMEEAAQITEIENFIPLVLQSAKLQSSSTEPQLKRVVLVGDHLQNSPVIQSNALRSYANLEQSLFQRLVRLGVPHILLDAQGRSRPSIAALYRWRYPHLTNLPFTVSAPEFVCANAGFKYEYQFIDVPDYKGRGESEPTPHFLQNLGEAEYAVALYQYMRLLGYPAERISILCTYAGQRALLRDVLDHRCKSNRLFGLPAWVGTVDKYQGEQNDYVILSLVRTRSPGYLRDIRRLTVALSRARLGLYVLGRRDVFESSLELRDAFSTLLARSGKLALVTNEMYPTTRTIEDEIEGTEMEGVEHLGEYVYMMTQAKLQALRSDGTVAPLQIEEQAGNGGEVENGFGADDDEGDIEISGPISGM